MKNMIVVMSSNRELEKQTKNTLAELSRLGALVLMESGSADVAFARCRALTWTCDVLREHPERDVVLMLDDDMDVPTDVAQALADAARELGRPCSAAYATLTSTVAASRWEGHPGLWLVGLGCLAIPRTSLLDLESRAEVFSINGKSYRAFTWCGPDRGNWIAEDYRLSINLGGVLLCPLSVGHIKKGSIWPDEGTLDRLEQEFPYEPLVRTSSSAATPVRNQEPESGEHAS